MPNPLGYWTKTKLEAYFEEHKLPRHPLEAEAYLSIGCEPCTSKVLPGEDPRAGRWRGWDKVDCGIHTSIPGDGEDEANQPVFVWSSDCHGVIGSLAQRLPTCST